MLLCTQNKTIYLFGLRAEATAALRTESLSAGSDKAAQKPAKRAADHMNIVLLTTLTHTY